MHFHGQDRMVQFVRRKNSTLENAFGVEKLFVLETLADQNARVANRVFETFIYIRIE